MVLVEIISSAPISLKAPLSMTIIVVSANCLAVPSTKATIQPVDTENNISCVLIPKDLNSAVGACPRSCGAASIP
jgi:hypothetical protein